MKNQILKLVSLFTLAFTLFSCSDDNNKTIVKLPTILEIAQADAGNFSILIAALNKTQLTATVNGPGSYTVFAPTNAAFTTAGITEASLAALNPTVTADAATILNIKKILQNHILGVGTKAEDLGVGSQGYVRTFSPYFTSTSVTLSMFVNKSGNDIQLNGGVVNGGAKITTANINASNGIVHVVDAVIALPTIVSQIKANPSQFSTLLSVVSSGVAGTFGDQTAVLGVLNGALPGTSTALTVYAPTNSAFTTATAAGGYLTDPLLFGTPALLDVNIAKVLKYHVQTNNFPAVTTSSFSADTATSNQLVTTLLTQKFNLIKLSLNISEDITQLATLPTDAKATLLNIQANNGVIFGISRVLKPVL